MPAGKRTHSDINCSPSRVQKQDLDLSLEEWGCTAESYKCHVTICSLPNIYQRSIPGAREPRSKPFGNLRIYDIVD